MVEFSGTYLVSEEWSNLVFFGCANPCVARVAGEIGVLVPGLVRGIGRGAYSARIMGVAFEPLETNHAENKNDGKEEDGDVNQANH